MPIGNAWQDGAFCVPQRIATRYIKFASEYQLKALMIILSKNGKASSREIAKILGCTESDADDFLDFWVEEGVLSKDGVAAESEPIEAQATAAESQTEAKPEKPQPEKAQIKIEQVKKMQTMPIPVLSPKDIVAACRESKELTELMRNAQEVLGKTLSHAEQELIINMVTYYGLPYEIVLTILHYYKTQKERGKAVGTGYIGAMAKNWSEDGITTLDAADERLQSLEKSDKLWTDIVALAGIRHKSPTMKQREMINRWAEEFSLEMIEIACNVMRENAEKPTLKYVDGVLKNWHKKGIKTPDDVIVDNEKHTNSNKKDSKKSNRLSSTPNFDIDEIAKKAMFDDNFDI